ncbi:MAG: hypothetical protein HYZ45_05140, partial [Burkholderiales bacterium]|nr:hypothetical protein [Burkholderiales bacterium]
MRNTLTPDHVQQLFKNGQFIEAHATALALYAQQPDDYELGLLFLQTALFIERADSVIAVLQDIGRDIPAQTRHLLLFQAQLGHGNCGAAWQHLAQTGLAPNSLSFHECAFRIASKEHQLDRALSHLQAIEGLSDVSLAHFFKKFEILKLQGKYDEIGRQITQLQQLIPRTATTEQAQLKLWQAGIAHDKHHFTQSLEITTQLLEDCLLQAGPHPVPASEQPVKTWTRQRQHQVIN